MAELESIYLGITLISLIVSIIFIVRWWGMTTDIKEIRKLLQNKASQSASQSANPVTKTAPTQIFRENTDEEIETMRVDQLKLKLKPNQCIVKEKRGERITIWSKQDWDEHVAAGKENLFQLMYKNY